MFAATSTTVKFEAFSTPEQQASAMAIDRSLTLFWTLVERLQAAADQHRPIGCNRFGYEGPIALTPGQAERFGAFPLGDPPETRQVDGH